MQQTHEKKTRNELVLEDFDAELPKQNFDLKILAIEGIKLPKKKNEG